MKNNFNYPTLYRYLKEDCASFLENHPKDKSAVEEQLKRIKERFTIQKP